MPGLAEETEELEEAEEKFKDLFLDMIGLLGGEKRFEEYLSLHSDGDRQESIRDSISYGEILDAVDNFYNTELSNGDTYEPGFMDHLQGRTLEEALRKGGKPREAARALVSNEYTLQETFGGDSYNFHSNDSQ